MGIVYYDIGIGVLIFNDPETSCAMPDDFLIEHRRMQIPMSQKAESEKRVCHPFREENSAHAGGDLRKCESDTANDQVLEKRCMLSERRL